MQRSDHGTKRTVLEPQRLTSTPDLLSFIFFVSSLIFSLTLCGCQADGGFHDIAFVRQAQREIRRIRNALEEYRIDHGAYPGAGSDLKEALTPYLSKVTYSEGERATEYTRAVLGAQNKLNQISNAVSGCSRIKDGRVKEAYKRVQESLTSYENILGGMDRELLPVGIRISRLQSLIDSLDPSAMKSLSKASLIERAGQIVEISGSLADTMGEEEVKHLNNIKNTFRWYKANLEGEPLDDDIERYSPEAELAALKEIVPESSVVVLDELIGSYCQIESSRDYYDFLLAVQADLDRGLKVVSMLDEDMPEGRKAAVVVQAQASLHRMADAICDYRREEGRFPEASADIESFLHPYFVETTMSGERIDRWEDVLNWFSVGPTYETADPNIGFEIKAQVRNENRTHISGEIRVRNQWEDIIKVFSHSPTYVTPDSSSTYFLKARARDSGLTWVTERPPVAGGKG